MKKILILVAVLIFLAPAMGRAQTYFFLGEDEAIGKTFPDITLNNTKGESVNLNQLREGKRSIFFFWATWCPHCRAVLEHINDIQNELDAKNIKFVLVDLGEPDKLVKKFTDKYNIAMDVYLDVDSSLAEQFGLVGLPTFLFVNEKGIIKEIGHSLPKNYEELFLEKES